MKMPEKRINMAIQVLPIVSEKEYTEVVDLAIGMINASGLVCLVTPFETVVEGSMHELLALVQDIQEACLKFGATELVINLKIHSNASHDLSISSKLEKYRE
jgi:uncharacterized protein YqgV (UPF0045/DUF77 family)